MSLVIGKQEIPAGDEKITSPANLKILLYCFLLNTLLFFGIFTTNIIYRTDVGRSVLGNSPWATTGRPLATIFLAVVQMGTPVVNLSPLPEIISLFIISVTCVYLARSYSVSSPFFAAVCTLPLAGQPYFLENMSYSFDSPFMALALSLSIFAAIVLTRGKKYGSVISGLLLFAVLNLYQAAVGAFFVAYMFFLIKDINTDIEPLKYLWDRLGRLTLSSCLAFLTYIPVARMFVSGDYASEHAGFVGLRHFGLQQFYLVLENTGHYVGSIVSSWQGTIMGYILGSIFLLSLIISVLQTIRKASAPRTHRRTVGYVLMSLAFGASTVILSYFPQMFLTRPVLEARVYIGVSSLLSCSCLVVYSYLISDFSNAGKYRQYIVVVPVCIVAYSLIVFAYAYSRANWAQQQYEEIVIGGLLEDVNQLVANKNIRRVAIAGKVGLSPLVENTGRKYPLILSMVDDYNFWGGLAVGGQTANFPSGSYWMDILNLTRTDIGQPELLDIIKNHRPLISRSTYAIYSVDNLMLIRFLPITYPYLIAAPASLP